ncbi:phage tail protein I [Celerinatantimonas sp. MCCC 1A17872]|uniref:phage tail protein I n=1 Tax=Celerinatantimonas sp. MCCC 1A17872 TaxID=3177514 RepID=UPI0038CA46AE
MTADQLLPPNATTLEKAMVYAMTPELPVPIRSIWSPADCPSAFLPYLAQSFSVDRWDENWSEDEKRAAIDAAYFIHQHKGTKAAVRRVVEPLGFLIKVIEWYQKTERGDPYTFELVIGVKDSGITDAMYTQMVKLINDAKPLRAALISLDIQVESDSFIYCGATSYDGEIITIYPYAPGTITVSGHEYLGGADHTIDTVSIYPYE